MSTGFRSASIGLGMSAAGATASVGYASLMGVLGAGVGAGSGAQAGYPSVLGPLGAGVAATGGVIVTPEIIRDDIEAAFVTHFDGVRISARQRRKLEELKRGIWYQAGQRFMTRAQVKQKAKNAARKARADFEWMDERKVA